MTPPKRNAHATRGFFQGHVRKFDPETGCGYWFLGGAEEMNIIAAQVALQIQNPGCTVENMRPWTPEPPPPDESWKKKFLLD